MADEQTGGSATTGSAPDLGWHPPGANPKDPGWYRSGSNPNDQAYWDGQHWTRRRHWGVNGWVEEDLAPTSRLSANPYSEHSQPRPRQAQVGPGHAQSRDPAHDGQWDCADVRFGELVGTGHGLGRRRRGLHASINGIDPGVTTLIGVNGYVTFIGGIVLLVFAGLAMTNNDAVLAVLTAVIAAATLVFAVYDMFRIVQKISQVTTSANASVSVGWGLITVLSAAVLAMVVSLVRLAAR